MRPMIVAAFLTTAAASAQANAQVRTYDGPDIKPLVSAAVDLSFPPGNGGILIAGQKVEWSRSVSLNSKVAKGFEDGRCLFDLTYQLSNVGGAAAGRFANLVRPATAGRASESWIPEEPHRIQNLRGLPAGSAVSIASEISLAPGTSALVINADYLNQVPEANEANNDGHVTVHLTGVCAETAYSVGSKSAPGYPYELAHVLLKNVKVAGLPKPASGPLKVDGHLASGGMGDACLLDLSFDLENHGGFTTVPFLSDVAVKPPPGGWAQAQVAPLAPGATTAVHTTVKLRLGWNSVTILAVHSPNTQGYNDKNSATFDVVVTACAKDAGKP